ncbi:hypothetical protein P6144_07715 [Sphingomonas sp. HITSZ_GF]|uniref:hypothetical protein n=1 Tax=Sphingomonas sp. HITSZ_GF TaxID=3037247 RepID=UPI00240DEDEA|nr:hypothetical protein [Sphingomonas sp. HITSZ_GF]MDG2533527.1 hypothetical protein [Sphingomonas sp. HITSZ_GF]
MDLIERYLGAVRWNLPAAKADDIVAELADLIAARIEDREEMLGRPLDRTEVSQVLREFGHPFAVAGQYHGQRALIGAEVFPFYWFALKVVLAIVAVIELVQMGGAIVVHGDFAHAVTHGIHGLLQSLLYNAALVTLAFAVIERTGLLDTYLAKWRPEELPDLGKLRLDLPPRKRWEPVFEIGFGIAFLIWWAGGFTIPFVPQDADVRITGAQVWAGLYWPVVLLVWARIALSLIGFLRPSWKPVRAALILACTAGTLWIAKVLHEAGQIVTVVGTDTARAARIQESLDKSLEIAVIVIAAVTAFQCAKELYQLYREKR